MHQRLTGYMYERRNNVKSIFLTVLDCPRLVDRRRTQSHNDKKTIYVETRAFIEGEIDNSLEASILYKGHRTTPTTCSSRPRWPRFTRFYIGRILGGVLIPGTFSKVSFEYSRTADWYIGNRRFKQGCVCENHYIDSFFVNEDSLSFFGRWGSTASE